MKQIYKQEVILSNMHTDRFGRLTPAALLYLVQEAAGAHCRLLGADGDRLGNLFWAVSRTKVEVEQLPRIGQTVTVKITDIDDENRKLSLSIRALLEEEKRAAEKAERDAQRAERDAQRKAEAEEQAKLDAEMAPYIVRSI